MIKSNSSKIDGTIDSQSTAVVDYSDRDFSQLRQSFSPMSSPSFSQKEFDRKRVLKSIMFRTKKQTFMIFSTYLITFLVFPTVVVYKNLPIKRLQMKQGDTDSQHRFYLSGMISLVNVGSFYLSLALGALLVNCTQPKMSNMTSGIFIVFQLFICIFNIQSNYNFETKPIWE